MRVEHDESFEFFENYFVLPTRCLAVQPGVVDFPARCVGHPGHHGPHGSAACFVGSGPPLPPTYWDNEDE